MLPADATLDSFTTLPSALLDSLPLAVAYVDGELNYRYVNRAFETWFRIPRQQLLGCPLDFVLGEETVKQAKPCIDEVLNGEPAEFDADVRQGSRLRPARISISPSKTSGETIGFYLLVQDRDPHQTDDAVDAVLDGLSTGYVALDADWRVRRFNAAAEAFYRKSRREVLGRRVEDIWPDGRTGESGVIVSEVMATGVAQRRRELRSTGRPDRTFTIDVVPLPAGGAALILEDLAEIRAVERALAGSEARFRNVAAALPGLLFVADAKGANTYVNDGFRTYTGLGDDALLGEGWVQVVHPDDQPGALALWSKAVETGSPYCGEFRMRNADGDYRWFVCNAVPDRDAAGTVVQWAGVGTDIHDRKLVEQALAIKRELLHSVVEASPDPIFAKNLDGTFRLANRAMTSAMGVAGRDITGLRDRDILEPAAAELIEATDARVFGGETVVIEEVLEDLGIASRTYLSTRAPLRDGQGRVIGLVGVARDISDRKDGERHRELLIAELNHRVKNTLAVVQSIATQTLRPSADPAQSRSAFDARLTTLAEAHDVLTQNSWDAIRLRELTERAVAPFRRAEVDRFELHGPDIRIEARTAVGFSLALHELATNAVKYGALSVDGGRVLIRWQEMRTAAGPRMKLVWREAGGPPVAAPQRRGFGSRMIERGLASELGGEVTLEFAPSGVICRIEAPLPY